MANDSLLASFDPAGADRPGKVIAVHLNYPSRIAQRGRPPSAPSYFLKPATSVSASGTPIERPACTELLAFEGEVALIIGSRARNLAIDEAWSAVGAVTAANDFGVYDLRHADKGSNLRNKGGDGFTPLGPAAIDARAIDPAALRVRTWVDGKLVQEDTTAGVVFPFVQLIADVSQLITLEPGDVILTGTPAGSSVVVPGQTVEVEVDAPGAPGAPTSGRLVTPVTEGTVRPGRYGAGPKVDDLQREEAWGSRAGSGPARPLRAHRRPPGEDRLRRNGHPQRAAAEEGPQSVSVDGVRPLVPGTRLVGRARTLRFIPAREDLSAAHGSGYTAQKRGFDALNPGDVLVVEARGERDTGTIGDILALRAVERGAAGFVSDGGVRDSRAVAETGLPVFAASAHPALLGRRHVPWDLDLTITCGGCAVQPGDVIVGDDNGVIVIPPPLVEAVVDGAIAQEDEERYIAEQVKAGHPVEGLYPLTGEWRAKYEAQRQ